MASRLLQRWSAQAWRLPRRGVSSSSVPPSSSGSTTKFTSAGLDSTKGGIGSIFDRSLKEHYRANKAALDRVGLSFLFFYCTGQIFMQKQRREELEEELALARREKKVLEADLRDEGWTKEAAARLGLKDASKLGHEINLRLRTSAGEMTTEDLARSTGDGKKANAIF